jgi:hypothetical protein
MYRPKQPNEKETQHWTRKFEDTCLSLIEVQVIIQI